jgi:hypothetical protein
VPDSGLALHIVLRLDGRLRTVENDLGQFHEQLGIPGERVADQASEISLRAAPGAAGEWVAGVEAIAQSGCDSPGKEASLSSNPFGEIGTSGWLCQLLQYR